MSPLQAPALAQWIEDNQDKEDIYKAINSLWEIVGGSTDVA